MKEVSVEEPKWWEFMLFFFVVSMAGIGIWASGSFLFDHIVIWLNHHFSVMIDVRWTP